MQVVEEKLEHFIREKLMSMPVDLSKANFVRIDEAGSYRNEITKINKEYDDKLFRTKIVKRQTKKGLVKEGIKIWRIKE